MKQLAASGRVIFAIPLIVFGLFHFINATGMAGLVPSYLPSKVLLVYISGAGLVLAGISIVLNILTRLSCILLAVMLLIFMLTIHMPGLADEMTRQMAMVGLLKDMALMGAALTFVKK